MVINVKLLYKKNEINIYYYNYIYIYNYNMFNISEKDKIIDDALLIYTINYIDIIKEASYDYAIRNNSVDKVVDKYINIWFEWLSYNEMARFYSL
jgi:hypothetical protein